LARGGVASDRDADGVHHRFRCQSQQLSGADHGGHAGDCRVVNAVAQVIKHIPNLAVDLISEDGCGDEIPTASLT
jgi:hypothetical protein